MRTNNSTDRLDVTWWALRILFGAVPIVAGLDKFFNLLTNWEAYLNPLLPTITHLSATAIMHTVGVVEIAAGVIVLSRWVRPGAYIVMAWLICIALNLLLMGKFIDVAVRDLGLAVAAFSLAQLSDVRAEDPSRIKVAVSPAAARS
jgi:uncharacterized membrane protein YphA (DoxX/SURF4 family)